MFILKHDCSEKHTFFDLGDYFQSYFLKKYFFAFLKRLFSMYFFEI